MYIFKAIVKGYKVKIIEGRKKISDKMNLGFKKEEIRNII